MDLIKMEGLNLLGCIYNAEESLNSCYVFRSNRPFFFFAVTRSYLSIVLSLRFELVSLFLGGLI